MGYKENVVLGEVPEYGAIFMSNIGTKKECFQRKLFGLPSAMANFVRHVKKGMILFLFEFERRQLYGVFQATSDGKLDIEPNAFKSSGKHFPAQVQFTQIWNCTPLVEHEFRDAIIDNYFSGKKFNFGLSKDQVRELMMLFLSKKIPREHPERRFLREGNKPSGLSRRFGDDRNPTNDRIGFSNDGLSSDISHEFVGDESDQVDDNPYLNGNFVGKNEIYGYAPGTATRPWKTNEPGFLKDYTTKSDNLGDRGDHCLGGFRDVADAIPRFTSDIHDEHGMHSNLEVRRVVDEDRFFVTEKIKNEPDRQDGYGRYFSEPQENRFRKIGHAGYNSRSGNADEYDPEYMKAATSNSNYCVNDRLQDEFPIENGFGASVTVPHLGSPSNGGSQRVDGHFFGNDIVETEQRTLAEPLPSKLHVDYDENFGFVSVAPTTNGFGHGLCQDWRSVDGGRFREKETVETGPEEEICLPEQPLRSSEFHDKGIPFPRSHDTTTASPIPYDPEIPHIDFGIGSVSSLVCNPSFYQTSKDDLTSMPMSESLRSLLQNEDSTRYLPDTPCYSRLSKINPSVSCNGRLDPSHRESQTAQRRQPTASLSTSTRLKSDFAYDDGSVVRPRKDSMRKVGENSLTSNFSQSNSSLGEIRDVKFSQAPENGTNRRLSVFDRLSSAPREPETVVDEQNDLESSVDKVMKMLEKVVNSPIKRNGKYDDEIVEHGPWNVKAAAGPDANVAYEEIGDGSILQETRLVDFKRRKRVDKSLDGNRRETSVVAAESERPVASKVLDTGPTAVNRLTNKRRKLVRPVFVGNENVNSLLKVESESTKAVERCDIVDASIDSVEPRAACENHAAAKAEPGSQAADGNSENREAAVEHGGGENGRTRPQETGTVDVDGKLCGWIEW